MMAEATPDWNVFKQIFAEHWDGFKRVYPRYNQRYYDELVHKMLACGNPDRMGYIEWLCRKVAFETICAMVSSGDLWCAERESNDGD